MTPHDITSAPQELEQFQPHDDSFLSQVDDEALEHALKTVNWNAMDVGQFLRAAAFR